jgi:outer membrane protein OmpA-like peptidoglycan-associated protein
MNRMMGMALALLAILGAALALWSPAAGTRDPGLKAELERVTGARDAAERALAGLRTELDQAKAAVNAAREDGERKLTAARSDGEKALAALRRETEGMVAAIKADADKAIAAAKAEAERVGAGGGDRLAALRAEAERALAAARGEAEKAAAALRDQLNQCQAAAASKPAGDSTRCTATGAPTTGPIAAADIARELADNGTIALYGIQFDSGKAKLTDESKASLDEVAKAMKDDPKLKLLVVGHTDSKGDFNTNRQLSEQRAQAVVNDLVGRGGVEPARLSSAGVADLAPVSTNETDAGRARNRRVELVKR